MGSSDETAEPYEGFETWYRSTWGRLVAALALVDGNLDAAVDAASEAFARALKDWSRVQGMENRDGWVYRVGMNLQHRRLRRTAMESRILRKDTTRHEVNTVSELLFELRMSIADLPRRQRAAMVLTYFADLTQQQVADMMGVTRGTVGSTLSDARSALSASWKEHP